MSWLLTVLSITGVILNVRKDRRAFLLWMVTNIGWMLIDLSHGLYAQAVLFGVYFVLALWGWIRWRTNG